jgi:hypothetical protein
MSANQPLRKPRNADGRPMTEDEIRALDGRELDVHVNCCIVDGDPVWLLPQNRSRVPHYSTDIAAAFDVDRPEWRWKTWTTTLRLKRTLFWFTNAKVWQSEESEDNDDADAEQHTVKGEHKPTPADHAKARCIAALLLAAKIGE